MNSLIFYSVGLIIFLLLTRLFLNIFRGKAGGSGKISDPVYVVRCNLTFFTGFGGMPMIGGPDVLEITLGSGFGNKLPVTVDLKFVYIDVLGRAGIGTVQSAKIKQNGTIGTVEVTMTTRLYPRKLYCRAWVTAAYQTSYGMSGMPWRNENADKEEEKAQKWILRQVKKLK